MLLVQCGADHEAERRYVVDVVLREFLGLDYDLRLVEGARDVTITSTAGDARRLSLADVLFAGGQRLVDANALPRLPLPVCPAHVLTGASIVGDLPVLYGGARTHGGFVERQADRIELEIDLFGGVFAMLTRLEEAVPGERDTHGRFPASESLAVRAGFASRPLVDEYVEVLWWALQRLWPRLERKHRSFATRPTHDVDWPFYSRGRPAETLRDAIADVRHRRDRSLALARVRALAAVLRSGRAADPCNTFEFLMRTSAACGVQCAFYFMGGATSPGHDAGYAYDSWLRALIRDIDRRGHELGLHPSYLTYRDADALAQELAALEKIIADEGVAQEIAGGRQHFLRWENPVTWRLWDSLGLRYDSTLGYAETCGFRCGTCHPYPAFDLETRRRLALIERPLIAMEAALLTYESKTLEETVENMRTLKATCRRFEGEFCFLWHNNRLQTAAERDAYSRVLD